MNLKIEGMTCAACAKAVERVSRKLEGVIEANVNIATEKLDITFDKSKVSINDIKRAIEKAGYKALEEKYRRREKGKRRCNKIFVEKIYNFFNICSTFAYYIYGKYDGIKVT